MQKKKQTKPIKQIIAFIAIIILLLLLVFAEDIIKLTNKNKTNLAENSENELISNEPNPPQLSAGMIPVKWDGANWIITTANDKDWYDYSIGKPAYIMLNDGYYQSELIRDMTNKELAENNVRVGVPDDPKIRGTIFVWIPRFAYKHSGEIGYIKEETEPGGEWIIPTMFSYTVADETKPNFSLSGVWVTKEIDTNYANKIVQMNQEESIYGFIANTKARQINSNDTTELQKYVGNDAPVVPIINDITNQNRIILQIINGNKYEPIKANITQNTTEEGLEIRVTYTSNGIKEILDEYGNKMPLIEEDGIIYTDTSNITLAKGTYKFTVIDNKGNKKELSIIPNINSLFKVAYINGTDNMDNTATYTKTQETKTTAENTLINQLKAVDSSKTYSRAITDSYGSITAVIQSKRTSEDEEMYVLKKYNLKPKYYAEKNTRYVTKDTYMYYSKTASNYGSMVCSDYSVNPQTGAVKLGKISKSKAIGSVLYFKHKGYIFNNDELDPESIYTEFDGDFYCGIVTKTEYRNSAVDKVYFDVYTMNIRYLNELKGDYISNVIAKDGEYKIGEPNSDGYWYDKDTIAPKYTLLKYDTNLNLQSTYDVDSKVLTTAPINISNKGNNKLKLTLNTTGTDYKTYISNDNTNWQEVTYITSNTPKELNVDGWDNLYIKIETNTSRINNMDIAFYKD